MGEFTLTSNPDDNGVGRPWSLIPAFAANITRKQIEDLANQTDVKQIEASFPTKTFTDWQAYQTQSGVAKVHTDFGYTGDADGNDGVGAGNHHYSTKDVVACVLDTGIDNTHPDLDEGQVLLFKDFLTISVNANINTSYVNATISGAVNLTVNALAIGTFTGDLNHVHFEGSINTQVIGTMVGQFAGTLEGNLVGLLNSTLHYNTPGDSLTWPHGTWVSGILAGQGDTAFTGVGGTGARYPGIANGTALVVGRVTEDPLLQNVSYQALIDGFQWCSDHQQDYNVSIISFSGGVIINPTPAAQCPDGTDAVSQAANNAWNRSMTVVIAAANLGSDVCPITSPGAAANVITVGAMNDPLNANTDNGGCAEDALQTKGWYLWPASSRGHPQDNPNNGAVKPEVVAPGVCITTPSPMGLKNTADCGTGTGFCTASGTSFATPFIASTVALMRQGNASLTNNETKRFLMQTAENWGPSLYAYPAASNYDFGAGRIQSYRAVDASGSVHHTGTIQNPSHYFKSTTLSATTPTVTYIAAPTDRTWWIAASVIAPGASEGTTGLVANLLIQPHIPNLNCPAAVTNVTAPREAQASYKVSAPCDASSFDIVVTAVSGTGPIWLDVSYGGPDLA